jgi:hypothetical protein
MRADCETNPISPLFSVCWYAKGFGKSEGRGLARACELLLSAGIHEYEREGSRHRHGFVDQLKQIQQHQVQSLLVREGQKRQGELPEEIFQSLRMNFIP